MDKLLVFLSLIGGIIGILISIWGFLKIRKVYTNVDVEKNKKLLLESLSQMKAFNNPKFFSTSQIEDVDLRAKFIKVLKLGDKNKIENSTGNKIKKDKNIIF